ILRIGRYQALAKILVDGVETNPFTLQTNEAPKIQSPRTLEMIELRMREKCWVDKAKVLQDIAGRFDRVINYANQKKNEAQVHQTFRTSLDEDNAEVSH